MVRNRSSSVLLRRMDLMWTVLLCLLEMPPRRQGLGVPVRRILLCQVLLRGRGLLLRRLPLLLRRR